MAPNANQNSLEYPQFWGEHRIGTYQSYLIIRYVVFLKLHHRRFNSPSSISMHTNWCYRKMVHWLAPWHPQYFFHHRECIPFLFSITYIPWYLYRDINFLRPTFLGTSLFLYLFILMGVVMPPPPHWHHVHPLGDYCLMSGNHLHLSWFRSL